MQPFKYATAKDAVTAVGLLGANEGAKILAGGTNIIDLMKEDVERPAVLIHIDEVNGANAVSTTATGGVSLNAFANNSDTANDPVIRKSFPLLTQAILAGASAQIRNMATNGGNLNQRTRCTYFYDTAMPCNKRNPGSGCGAFAGVNRMHAVFGWSESCIAVNPSDMCVALAALDAQVKVTGAAGEQTIAFTDYHRLPENNPQKDNNLQHGQVITSIDIPANNFSGNSYYLKVRDRSSYAFALVSVAAALELRSGTIGDVRIALGGVAHKPWRATEAEQFLKGKSATDENFKAAASIAMKNAKAFEHNQYKISMATKAILRALQQAANGGINE